MKIDKFGTFTASFSDKEGLSVTFADFEFDAENFRYGSDELLHAACVSLVCDFLKHKAILQAAEPTSEVRQ